MHVIDGYRSGVELASRGTLAIGNALKGPCGQIRSCDLLPSTGLRGSVYSAQIYSVALAPAEIYDDFRDISGSSPSLKLYWRLTG